MAAKEKPFAVGQEVWLIPRGYRGNQEVDEEPVRYNVAKVGPRWATIVSDSPKHSYLGEIYVDMADSWDEGFRASRYKKEGHGVGWCYADIGAKMERDELRNEWHSLKNWISSSFNGGIPKGVTADRIRQARELLGIPKED